MPLAFIHRKTKKFGIYRMSHRSATFSLSLRQYRQWNSCSISKNNRDLTALYHFTLRNLKWIWLKKGGPRKTFATIYSERTRNAVTVVHVSSLPFKNRARLPACHNNHIKDQPTPWCNLRVESQWTKLDCGFGPALRFSIFKIWRRTEENLGVSTGQSVTLRLNSQGWVLAN